MSDHKAPLIIVGETCKGKTLTLAMAALEFYSTVSDKENIVIFVSDEETPAGIAERLASCSSHEGIKWAAQERDEMLDHFYYATPEDAAALCDDFRAKNVYVFIDCVGQTSMSVDHEGMRVSFHGVQGEILNSLMDTAHLQGVTVSNWGG